MTVAQKAALAQKMPIASRLGTDTNKHEKQKKKVICKKTRKKKGSIQT